MRSIARGHGEAFLGKRKGGIGGETGLGWEWNPSPHDGLETTISLGHLEA